jgi:Ni,Fe-hydrogenase III large subunit
VRGFVARASGIDTDARRDHPFAAYGELPVTVVVFDSGDVKARTLVRVEEARESARLIRQAIERMPAGPLIAPLGPLPADQAAFGITEGWRGMIIHWVMVDNGGKFRRVKVLDSSFLNWRPLSYALFRRRARGDSRAFGDPMGAVSSGELGPVPGMATVEPAREGRVGAG